MHIKHSKYIFHQMATQIAWSTRWKHTHQAGKALGTANVSVAESAQMLGSGVDLQNSGQQRRCSPCSLERWQCHPRQVGRRRWDGRSLFAFGFILLFENGKCRDKKGGPTRGRGQQSLWAGWSRLWTEALLELSQWLCLSKGYCPSDP